MSSFPEEIFEPRETENLPGIVYNPADKKNFYSEDFQNLGTEINAIENALGTEPAGAYATVKAWLTALTEAISGLVVSFLDLSDTPSSYSGQAGKIVAVNTEEDALEFIDAPSGGGGGYETLASVDLSGGASSSLSSGTFTAKKNLRVIIYWGNVSSQAPTIRFNGDAGSNYSGSDIDDGTAQGSWSGTAYRTSQSPGTSTGFLVMDIYNVSSLNKQILHNLNIGDLIVSGAGKWNNTSSQITSITLISVNGNFPTSTSMKVLGFD